MLQADFNIAMAIMGLDEKPDESLKLNILPGKMSEVDSETTSRINAKSKPSCYYGNDILNAVNVSNRRGKRGRTTHWKRRPSLSSQCVTELMSRMHLRHRTRRPENARPAILQLIGV